MAAILHKSSETIDILLRTSYQITKEGKENDEAKDNELEGKTNEEVSDTIKEKNIDGKKNIDKEGKRGTMMNINIKKKFYWTKDSSNKKQMDETTQIKKEITIETMKDNDRRNILHTAILSKDKEVLKKILDYLGKYTIDFPI